VRLHRPRFVPAVRLPAYGSLLAASFTILMLMPLFASVRHGFVFERILSGIVIVAAFVATGLPLADSWKLLAVLLPLFAANSLGDARLEDATIVSRIALLSWAEYRVLRQFLAQDEVGWDTVAAASAGFILIAVIWSNVYLLLEHLSPGRSRSPRTSTSAPSTGCGRRCSISASSRSRRWGMARSTRRTSARAG